MTEKVNKSRRSSVQPSAKNQEPSPRTSKRKVAEMGQETRMRWLSQDAWSKRELMDLLCGLEPDQSRPSSEETNQVGEEIGRAVETNKLAPIPRIDASPGDAVFDNHQLFAPSDAIKWAASTPDRFPRFPFTAEDIVPHQSSELPLNKKERTSLYLIIASLAKLGNVNLTRPYKAAEEVLNAMGDLPAGKVLTISCVGPHLQRADETANPADVRRKPR